MGPMGSATAKRYASVLQHKGFDLPTSRSWRVAGFAWNGSSTTALSGAIPDCGRFVVSRA